MEDLRSSEATVFCCWAVGVFIVGGRDGVEGEGAGAGAGAGGEGDDIEDKD